MAPKRSHARNASAASASTNHVKRSASPTTTPPASITVTTKKKVKESKSPQLPMTLMGRTRRYVQPLRLVLLPVLAMGVSAALYTGAHNVLVLDELSAVTKEPEVWRQVVSIATRITALYAQWFLGFDAINTFAVTLHVRLPFYFLLYLFYGISLQTVAVSALIDAASSSLAFLTLQRRRPENYASRAAAQSAEATAVYDLTNVTILTALATSIFGVALYILSASKLPEWVILSFDHVATVERPHTLQLGQFLALALPLGWSLRAFVFGPATRVDSTGHRRQLTVSITNRAVVLSVFTFVEAFVRTYTTVEGASFRGAGLWATIWALLIWIVGAALVGVGEAAEPEEYETEDESD